MSVKHKLEKLDKASLASDQKIIIARECLDDRGRYELDDYKDLGLLSLEEIEKHFEDEQIIYVKYMDNWRGDL